jgi:hypothetical protein
LQNTLNSTNPNGRSAMSINNLKMHTVLWGPPNIITISLTKNNVWDRRLHEFQAPTLQEIIKGAFSPANKDYVGVKEIDSTTFANVDILNLPVLAGKLAGKTDTLSAVLSARLDDKTIASLATYLTAQTNTYFLGRVLMTNIVADLNVIIDGTSLYNEKLFQNVR